MGCKCFSFEPFGINLKWEKKMNPIKQQVDLTTYLSEKYDAPDLAVMKMTRVEQGMSSDTFFIDLNYTKNQEAVKKEIVLKREPSGGIQETYDLSKEFSLLKALKDGGIAVPQALWYEPRTDIFERPFYVMEKVEGDVFNVDPRRPSKLMFKEHERPTLAEDFVSNIVKVHNFDWQNSGLAFPDGPVAGKEPLIRQIEHHEQAIERAGYRSGPIVALGLNWLKHNAPEIDKLCIVHGDYRIGNFISKDGRIQAVIDWEFSHLGDPHEDVAYILSPAWRSADEGLVNHLMTDDVFIRKYQQMSGISVDPYKVMYYGAINILKGLDIMCMAAKNVNQGQSGDLRDVIHAMSVDSMLEALMGVINILTAIKREKI
jgi:aminoglycoside phosphotransferase (APT) family kinase protein